MVAKLDWHWLSYSYKGTNQGCCNIQATDKAMAIQKAADLEIQPKYDDLLVFVLPEPELEPDKLYSPQDLVGLGHTRIKT